MRLARNAPERALKASFSGRQRNHFFANRGDAGFAELSGVSGLDDPGDSRGFAVLDYDRDGRPDVALVGANRPRLSLFHNRVARSGVIAVRLVGANRSAVARRDAGNRDGIGARVEVAAAGRVQVRELRAGEGLAAQNSSTLLFGLDDAPAARRVTVRWPTGVATSLAEVAAGTQVTAYEDPAAAPAGTAFETAPYLRPPRGSAAPPAGGPALALPPAGGAGPPLTLVTSVATWCQACRDELPRLRYLRHSLPPSLRFVGLAIDDGESQEALTAFAAEHRPPYELLTRPDPALRQRFRDLGLRVLHQEVVPTTALVDAEGRVRRLQAGVPTLSDVRDELMRAADPEG